MTPRAIRMKCVMGRISPITCAQPGMPRKGKRNPESRMDGKNTKTDICMACSWFFAMVENVMPMARLAAMKKREASNSRARLPWIGTSKMNLAAARIMVTWM